MWKFLVKNQSIEILEREVLADHQIQYVQFKFTFDGDWKRFHKVVQFSQCDEIYSIVLGFDGTTCHLPAELHVGAVKMSVFGYDAESDTTVRATTVPITLNIRESGFVGDDDTPIPPTPDLYTQLLRKITEIQAGVDGKDGLSAYEIAKENGFVGTVSEWLESLKGADGLPGKDGKNGIDGKDGIDGQDGRDGVDGVTPDLSEYPKTTTVEKMIHSQIASMLESSHTHENLAVLDSLTTEDMAMLGGLQQFEDSTKYEIQIIRESVEPVISQAHWHHNLTLLNSITSAKIAKWDKISEIETELQQLRDSTQYDQQNQNDAILNLENRIAVLESKITSGNNAVTLFSAGTDALNLYGSELFTIYNNAYNSIADFSANYPHFISADNDYKISFSIDDFGWDGVVYVVCTMELNLSEKSQISMCYQSGAAEPGDLYLVSKPERNDVPISVYVYTQIQNGTAIKIPFQWLYSDSCITTLSDCNVSSGIYYFAFAGRSNNTHPMIKQIQVLG